MSASTWKSRPATGDWNTKGNWDGDVVPTTKATFRSSDHTAISFSSRGAARVDEIEFADDAPSYTFTFGSSTTPALTIAGHGIVNDSKRLQSFIVAATGVSYKDPQLKFTGSATAGGHDMHYAAGPETLQLGHGGGIIGFCDTSTAGSASFTVRTGKQEPPSRGSTVGGEVSFSQRASAANARFTIYGTLGTDGDTFGNAVFHDNATADHATFTNIGGTVSDGDGGNTEFYDTSTAAHGVFHNKGGTHFGPKAANGGDVAFDGTATGGHGSFHNHPATVANANGGVTSFNNNCPPVMTGGASAGRGCYHNYGATESGQGGGGHTEFSARHGSPTAADATFHNYGSVIEGYSSAGHTILSVSITSPPTPYYPTAGHGTFWNHHAAVAGGAAGYTEFSLYTNKTDPCSTSDAPGDTNVPTAGDGTFHNVGGNSAGVAGGYTSFGKTSTAGNALLIAHGGTNGGYGGKIAFYDASSGGTATVHLIGNGVLDIGDHTDGVTIGALHMAGGVIKAQLGTNLTGLTLSRDLILDATPATFSFWKKDGGGFAFNTAYTILTAPNLSRLNADQFTGNPLENVSPTFAIVGDALRVSFNDA